MVWYPLSPHAISIAIAAVIDLTQNITRNNNNAHDVGWRNTLSLYMGWHHLEGITELKRHSEGVPYAHWHWLEVCVIGGGKEKRENTLISYTCFLVPVW